VNKRQRKKQTKRRRQSIDRPFKRLSNPDEVRQVSMFVSSLINKQYEKATRSLRTPRLDPPYTRWADEGNVVHWVGINTRERFDIRGPFDDCRILRLCDLAEVDEDRMVMPNEVVTCVRCQALDLDRMHS